MGFSKVITAGLVGIACCLLIAGCEGEKGSGVPSKDPKSSYGKAVKRAHDLQTPSAAEQDKLEQEAELLRD